jgi:hypothetical protein
MRLEQPLKSPLPEQPAPAARHPPVFQPGLPAQIRTANGPATAPVRRLRRTALSERRNDSRNFSDFTSSSRPSSPAAEPNWLNKPAAVFGPTPGTPGMLSTLSPINASQSTICDGSTHRFWRAPVRPSRPPRSCHSGFNNPICGDTSCIKSLSALAMTTAMPACAACRARQAM